MNPLSRLSDSLNGFLLLFLSMWLLSALDASGKWLLGAAIPLLVVAWFRYFVHFALMMLLVLPSRQHRYFKSQSVGFQLLRALAVLSATLMFFTSLTYLPQAQATAIMFMAPLIMLGLAPWLLGEPKRLSRWVAAAGGFVGVLIVVRPDSGLDPIGVLFALASAILFALQHICTRRLAVDHPMTTLIWTGMVGAVLLTAALPFVWSQLWPNLQTTSLNNWMLLSSLGITGALGHLCQIQAYRLAPASLLAPFIYLQIVAAASIGWLVWGDFPDRVTWIGIAIICASGIGIGLYEWHTRRQTTFEATKRPA